MSHIGVRIVANWLRDTVYGVNAITAIIPRDGADPAPTVVHIYDETRHGWVARNEVPRPTGGLVQFPAVVVFLQNGRIDTGVPDDQSTGARTVDGTLSIAVQLLMEKSATELAATEAMYTLRAIRNSLLQLNDPSRDAQRTLTGVRLEPATDCQQGQLDAPLGETILSAGAFILQYPTVEVTALTTDPN